MSPVKVQDGGGDSLPVDEAGDQIKPNQIIESVGQRHVTDSYEGPSPKTSEKTAVREDKPGCVCSQTDGGKTERKSHQKTAKSVPHRRREDRHLLQFDTPKVTKQTKKTLDPILIDPFSEDEMESSPLIEDKSKEIQLKRQQQYRVELSQQISQREETRAQQKTKRNLRAAQRLQGTAVAATAESAARGSRSAVESYENQLRMEQMDGMRKQLAAQREREVQRLRRIYRKDDRKFLAHLHRLKLQENDPYGQGEGEGTKETSLQVASAKPETAVSSQTDVHKELKLKQAAPECETTETKPEVSETNSPAAASPRTPLEKSEKDRGDDLQPQKSSSTSSHVVEKPVKRPLTFKRAYLRLQQQRRAEEMLVEERRAKAEAWRAELARQERLQREVRNMAEWRSGYSLAGVPLAPISSAQKRRFEAAASWLENQRGAQQGQRIERDRQLLSWRDEKDRQIKERRIKTKTEEKIAREMQNERRKEAEKCFQRWLLEVRARKAAEMASVPRGALGVSTYSSAYSLPSPWRKPPKKVWRGRNCTLPSPNLKTNENITHKVLS